MATPNGSFVKYDDVNPTVQYDVGDHVWYDSDDDAAYNNTMSLTPDPGATVRFEFLGKQVVVVGNTVAPADPPSTELPGPVSYYTLDDSPSVMTVYKAATNATSVTLFDSGALSPGKHSLEITVDWATDATPFYLDYIAVLPADGAPVAGTSSDSTPSATTTTPAHLTSASTTSLTSGSPSTSGGPPSRGSSGSDGLAALNPQRTAAIVGGIIGGVALLGAAAMAVCFVCLRRRRRSRAYQYTGFSGAALFDEDERRRGSRRAARESDIRAAHIEPFLIEPLTGAYADTAGRGPEDNERRPSLASPPVSPPPCGDSPIHPDSKLQLVRPTAPRAHTRSASSRVLTVVNDDTESVLSAAPTASALKKAEEAMGGALRPRFSDDGSLAVIRTQTRYDEGDVSPSAVDPPPGYTAS